MMFSTPIALSLSLLQGCVPPEVGINDTRIVGTIQIPPETWEEVSNGTNGIPSGGEALEPLFVGYRIITGTLDGFGVDENGQVTSDADQDHYALVSQVARNADAPDGQFSIEVTVDDPAAMARLRIYNLDVTIGPQNIPTEEYSGDFMGTTSVSLDLESDINYAIGIDGLEGTAETGYTMVMLGQHPDNENILVGAYTEDDPSNRGHLVAGTNAKSFELKDDYVFEAWYEMLFVRIYEVYDTADDILDENVKSGFIYAGNWPVLNNSLPAGTWHTGTPIPIDFTKTGDSELHGTPPYEDTGLDPDDPSVPLIRDVPTYPTIQVEDPVMIDEFAPVVVGFDIYEIEPNDTDVAYYFEEKDLAQDLGSLSGPGFVDIVSGAIIYDSEDQGWSGENDTFKFQVPESSAINFTMSWGSSGTDLDILMLDAEGNIVDYGYYGFPEVPVYGTSVLYEPGMDYYIAILLWSTPDPLGTSYPWELTLEQLAP